MTTRYYKTNDSGVLTAVEQHRANVRAVHEAGAAFGKLFDGQPVYAASATDVHFAGLRFTPRRDRRLWTAPDSQYRDVQRPRTTLPSGGDNRAQEKVTLEDLKAKWKASYPKERAELQVIFEALGTDWGNAMMSGYQWFEHDGYFYFGSGMKLNDAMVEIFGSEFDAAYQASKTEGEEK